MPVLTLDTDRDVRHLPLSERKVILKRALKGLQRVLYATHIEGHGEALYGQSVAQELEGVVAKGGAGRNCDWVKIKTPIGREREAKLGLPFVRYVAGLRKMNRWTARHCSSAPEAE